VAATSATIYSEPALQESADIIVTCLFKIKKKCLFINAYISSFLILNYNLFALLIILLLSISFNCLDNSAQIHCVNGKEFLKMLTLSSQTSCHATFIKTLANNSFALRDLPFSDIKPLLQKNSTFYNWSHSNPAIAYLYDKNNPAILNEIYLKINNVLVNQTPCYSISKFGQVDFGDIISIKNGKADCISLKAFTTHNENYIIDQLSKAPKSTSIQVLDGFNNSAFSKYFENNFLPEKGLLINHKPLSNSNILNFLDIYEREFSDGPSFKDFSNNKIIQPFIKGHLKLINHGNN